VSKSLTLRTSVEGVDWERVAALLAHFGLSHDDAQTQRMIFERSYAVVFAYDEELLVGCGRAISDGIRQAAIYNVALYEAYQGQQVGRAIVESLKERLKGCTITLYTHPNTVALYEKLGFRRQKTGMVILSQEPEVELWMEEVGFLLPRGHRFPDTESTNQGPDRRASEHA
jgi:ribosomal protein S18 acetylase RimI-like enzyme